MDCQECQKRPAKLHFTQLIQQTKVEIYVCEVCAREKGYMAHPEEAYSLQNLLSSLFHYKNHQIDQQSISQLKQLVCPQCHLTLSRFQKAGTFGCEMCYKVFSNHLPAVFRRIHSGNIKHLGKVPKRVGKQLYKERRIDELRSELKQLVETEAFEQAAVIRDKIRLLEGQFEEKESDDS